MQDPFLQLFSIYDFLSIYCCYVHECPERPVKSGSSVIKYRLTLLCCFLFPCLLRQWFVYLFICLLLFSLSLSSDIFDTEFWSSPLSDSREVSTMLEKMKFTALVPQLYKSLQQVDILYLKCSRYQSFSC